MNIIQVYTINYSKNSILYEFEAGKPDPTQKFEIGSDKRKRVYQSSQKGPFSCTKYVLNRMRVRIGKVYDVDNIKLSKKRKVEQTISKFHKEYTKATEETTGFVGLHTETIKEFSEFLSRRKSKEQEIYFINHVSQLVPEHAETLKKTCHLLFDAFKSQKKYRDFESFYEAQKQLSTQRKLNCCIDLIKKFNQFEQIEPILNSNGYTLNQKQIVCKILTEQIELHKFGMQVSEWSPDKKIVALYDALKKHGPLYATGNVGMGHHTDKPQVSKTAIPNKKIFYWQTKGDKIGQEMGHAIIIVGVDKIKKNVYYIDPADPSDPKNKHSQRIFAISYKTLQESMLSDHGLLAKTMPKEQMHNKNWLFYSPYIKILSGL